MASVQRVNAMIMAPHGRRQKNASGYPDWFWLWPVSGGELADELEAWHLFTAWRDGYDSGLRPGPFPGDRQSGALERVRRRREQRSPQDAQMAIPEWRLDHNRSFAGRIPAHMVRWTFVN